MSEYEGQNITFLEHKLDTSMVLLWKDNQAKQHELLKVNKDIKRKEQEKMKKKCKTLSSTFWKILLEENCSSKVLMRVLLSND